MAQTLTKEEMQTRWDLSWQAHQNEVDKYALIDIWFYAFEKHLRIGEDWNESFRFPELFGAIKRKHENIIEYYPNMRVKGDGNGTIALQSAYNHQTTVANIDREKQKANFNAIKYGWGCMFVAPVRYEREVKGKGLRLFYDGLGAESIDPRDFIPAYSALQLHDHTGQNYCPYVFRRRVMLESTFKHKYSQLEGAKIDMDEIGTVSYDGGFAGTRQSTAREGVEKQGGKYVVVLEYWDQERDEVCVFANSFENKIYESSEGIPYSHKQLPFHMYYNYKREDSIFGISEVEINMPYSLFRETVLDLMIKNAKLELQPAHFVDGAINFDTENLEIEPGAIFSVNGINNGKLSDSIVPFRTGGFGQDVSYVVQQIENSRITVTGDDTTSLYANPNQLATQTNAKREASQKGVRGNILMNTVFTEFYLANQIVSYLKNELCKPYKNDENKTVQRKITIQGYQVIQDKKESSAEFKKIYGANSSYYLNKEMAEQMDGEEIEIVSDKLDEALKADKLEKMTVAFGQISQIAQVSPQLLQDMDFTEYLKETFKSLNLDIGKIFPALDVEAKEFDVIDREHDQIAFGVVPKIKPDEESDEHFKKHMEFKNSKIFKDLSKRAKDAFNKHITLTIANVQKQISEGGEMEELEKPMQQTPVQGMVGDVAGGGEVSGTGVPPQTAQAGIQAGFGQRSNPNIAGNNQPMPAIG